MSNTSENSVIQLNLFIDEEKQKVVFAEAGKDFVDILFSLLTLPMGTIVRSMKKFQKAKSIGCFNNIYSSVANMEMKHFSTEICKEMLLYPKSLNQEKCQNIKLRIDDYEAIIKCFTCPSRCINRYSNFNTSRCTCGKLMSEVVQINKKEGKISGQNDHTSFIITDDLKVQVITAGLTLNVLKDLGYADCDNLVERIHKVNLREVMTILECLFTSDTPLTDTFLKKRSSYGTKSTHKTLSPVLCEDKKESEADQTVTLNAYVNKKEGNILYVECGEDFVDLLFTFLAMPLESLWETSGNISIFGCIGNLCQSFKDLSADYQREAKCVLPYYYKCQKQLLDVVTTYKPPTYYRFISKIRSDIEYSFTENSGMKPYIRGDTLVPVIWIDPKSEGDLKTAVESTTPNGGFVKRGIKFMVTNDLIITPSNLTSTFRVLKEKQIKIEDVEVKVIIIRKEEAIKLLEASLVTVSALSTGLLSTKSASTSDQQS